MSDLNQSMWKAVKKHKYAILVILLLPLVFAIYSYKMATSSPKDYSASIEIQLADFNNTYWSSQSTAKQFILSNKFLQETRKSKNLNLSVNRIRSMVMINGVNSSEIAIEAKGTDKKLVTNVVRAVSGHFLDVSNRQYKQHVTLVKQSIARAENQKITNVNAYNVEKLLYDLKEKLLDWRMAQVTEPMKAATSGSSPIVKAVSTYILAFGLLLVLAIVLLLFKNRRKLNNHPSD